MFEVIHIYYIFIYYIYYIYIHYYLLYFYYIYIYIITYIYRGCFVNLILFNIFVIFADTNKYVRRKLLSMKLSWLFYSGLFKGQSSTFIWNVFFVSYNNAMIEIRHCYWKIVHEHENLWKVTLKGEKLESQYSPF